tara:strand:- start:33812 stop:34465 length:654 start_codon:yes stop_codon:yes gene_type:complete
VKSYTEVFARLKQVELLSKADPKWESVLDELRWVLESDTDCPFCSHPQRSLLETQINNETKTVSFIEQKMNWPIGTAIDHMENHLEYDPAKSGAMEAMRQETINTLNTAEDLLQRMNSWLDEWEEKKDIEGISEEWILTATRLASECNRGLKLVGTLKKEIGVDSQILLAQRKVDMVMGILVESLQDQPNVLDAIEIQIAALKEPTYIQDTQYEVID